MLYGFTESYNTLDGAVMPSCGKGNIARHGERSLMVNFVLMSIGAVYTVRSKCSRTEFFTTLPTNAIYRVAIKQRSLNHFSQEWKLALV